jgi:hypothetical protein
MASVLLFRDDKGPIDGGWLLGFLQSLAGVSDIRVDEVHGARIHCSYTEGEDSVLVELLASSLALVISDLGPAACDLAVRLQACSNVPLRIIDEGYSFDLLLGEFNTAAELDAGIEAAFLEGDE